MPEILEVEYYRQIAVGGLDRPIEQVDAPDDWFLKRGLTAPQAREALEGERLTAARRRGKLLLADVSSGAVLGLRFGMTGRLLCDDRAGLDDLAYGSDRENPDWDRFTLRFADGGSLVLRDPRRLGGVELDPDESRLGPDALALTPGQLRDALGESTAPLKARLMDQARGRRTRQPAHRRDPVPGIAGSGAGGEEPRCDRTATAAPASSLGARRVADRRRFAPRSPPGPPDSRRRVSPGRRPAGPPHHRREDDLLLSRPSALTPTFAIGLVSFGTAPNEASEQRGRPVGCPGGPGRFRVSLAGQRRGRSRRVMTPTSRSTVPTRIQPALVALVIVLASFAVLPAVAAAQDVAPTDPTGAVRHLATGAPRAR